MDRHHQCRGASVSGGVGIGASRKQLAHGVGRAIERRVHQRRRASGATRVCAGTVRQELARERRGVAAAERRHEAHSAGIRRLRRALTGKVVRPLGTLVDPGFEDLNVAVRKLSGGRHLLPELIAHELQVEPAALAVERGDDGKGSAAHCCASFIESVHLLRWSVTADAVFLQQRLHGSSEIHLGCGPALRGREPGHQRNDEERTEQSSHMSSVRTGHGATLRFWPSPSYSR